MTNSPTPQSQTAPFSHRRRRLIRYLAGGGLGAIALGLVRPETAASREPDLEFLCSMFPQNSRCVDYLPGVQALDEAGQPIAVDTFLPTTTPGEPVPVRGLPDPEISYLVIETGPAMAPQSRSLTIATYGIRPICPHRGCTVDWQSDQNRFICPCHGSQFDPEGRVVKGPAKRPLPLMTVVERQNQIRLVERAPSIDPR